MISVTLASFAALSSIYCAIKSHAQRIDVEMKFNDFDDSICHCFGFFFKYKKCNQRSSIFCVIYIFICATLAVQFLSTYNAFDDDYLIYAWQLTVLVTFVRLEALQILLFIFGVKTRLKILMDELEKFLSLTEVDEKVFSEKLKDFQRCILKLHLANQSKNRYFGIPLLFNFIQLHSSITINIYWLGSAILGNPYASIVGR